jgi:type IV pilus biogenesis protein CpaD/CtpE
MTVHTIKPLSVLAVTLVLGACSNTLPLNKPDNFGAAVRHNMEMQIVNPAAQPEPGPTPMEGNRAAIAIQRYEADKVKPPKSLNTSGINVGGGGGGGSR